MKKRLIILVRSVETLNQSQQCRPIKICEFCFDICPRGLRFRLTFGHMRVHDSTHPGQTPEIWLVMSHTSHHYQWEPESQQMNAEITERSPVTEEIFSLIERVTF